MARLEMMTLIGPAVVAVASGAGDTLQLNRLERKTTQGLPDNVFMDNIGLIVDGGLAVLAVGNHLLPQPVIRQGSSELAASGVTVAVRRATEVIGRNVLGLQRVVTRNPARRRANPGASREIAAYSPHAAIEAPVNANKRQFFSVT